VKDFTNYSHFQPPGHLGGTTVVVYYYNAADPLRRTQAILIQELSELDRKTNWFVGGFCSFPIQASVLVYSSFCSIEM
jgi:hypothetical protein